MLGSDSALNVYGGKGSGAVKGFDHVNYLDGLKQIYGNKIIRSVNTSENEIRSADMVLYFLHKTAGEGSDYNFYLGQQVNEDISKVSRLNKNIVVIYSGGNAIDMPWLQNVKGLVYAYFLGQYRESPWRMLLAATLTHPVSCLLLLKHVSKIVLLTNII